MDAKQVYPYIQLPYLFYTIPMKHQYWAVTNKVSNCIGQSKPVTLIKHTTDTIITICMLQKFSRLKIPWRTWHLNVDIIYSHNRNEITFGSHEFFFQWWNKIRSSNSFRQKHWYLRAMLWREPPFCILILL